jgi:hypothetical protein
MLSQECSSVRDADGNPESGSESCGERVCSSAVGGVANGFMPADSGEDSSRERVNTSTSTSDIRNLGDDVNLNDDNNDHDNKKDIDNADIGNNLVTQTTTSKVVPAEVVLDSSSRMFQQDLPYGLCLLKLFAVAVDIPTPTYDAAIQSLQKFTGREYLAFGDSSSEGSSNNICPGQDFGTLSSILPFLEKGTSHGQSLLNKEKFLSFYESYSKPFAGGIHDGSVAGSVTPPGPELIVPQDIVAVPHTNEAYTNEAHTKSPTDSDSSVPRDPLGFPRWRSERGVGEQIAVTRFPQEGYFTQDFASKVLHELTEGSGAVLL